MTTRAKSNVGVGLKFAPLAGPASSSDLPATPPKKDKIPKAQITLHIPLEMEKSLREEYMAQTAGHRGRFSDYVFQFLKAGREAMKKG